jgi:HEPN domain-containing protein
MVRRDFQNLSVLRVREARRLADAGLYDGAYYLGGLAIECALKSTLARTIQRYEFPDLERTRRAYTHNLEVLLKLSGLDTKLDESEPQIQAAWARVSGWNVETRYQTGRAAADVLEFLEAVAGRRGVLRWLKRYW